MELSHSPYSPDTGYSTESTEHRFSTEDAEEDHVYAEIRKEYSPRTDAHRTAMRRVMSELGNAVAAKGMQSRAQMRLPEGERPYGEGFLATHPAGRGEYYTSSAPESRTPGMLGPESVIHEEEGEDAYSGEYSMADAEDDQVYLTITNDDWDLDGEGYAASAASGSYEPSICSTAQCARVQRPPTQVVFIMNPPQDTEASVEPTSEPPCDVMPNDTPVPCLSLTALCVQHLPARAKPTRPGGRRGLLAAFILFSMLLGLLAYLGTRPPRPTTPTHIAGRVGAMGMNRCWC